MSLEDFAEAFADAIEVEHSNVTGDTEFKGLEIWDSLCVLTVIAMVDTKYDITVTGNDLENAKTVSDIFEMVRLRMK